MKIATVLHLDHGLRPRFVSSPIGRLLETVELPAELAFVT